MEEGWGVDVEPKIAFRFGLQNHQRKLRITTATPGQSVGLGKENSVIQYSLVKTDLLGGVDLADLCSFAPNENESCPIELVIDAGDIVKFSVTGDRVIRLSGSMELRPVDDKASEQDLKSPNIPSNSMFRSGNIIHRVFERRLRNPPPGASVTVNRRFFENILPSSTVCRVQGPPEPQTFLKFTDDGKYLISFSDEQQSVIIYGLSLCSFSSSLVGSSRASQFSSYATLRNYTLLVEEQGGELVRAFFVHLPEQDLGIFASASTGLDSTVEITLHLIRLCNGLLIQRLILRDDFIMLGCNNGVHVLDNILVLTSSRNQVVMIYEVGLAGFTHKTNITFRCLQEERQSAMPRDDEYVPSFFRQTQLLDGDHMFLKFGSNTSKLAGDLYAIYNMTTKDVVPFYKKQNSYEFFDTFDEWFNLRDHITTTFNGISRTRTRHNANIAARLLSIRHDKNRFSQAVNHLLADNPFECQRRSPSPYFDPSLFQFNEVASADYQPNDQDIKWVSPGWHRYEGQAAELVSLRHPLSQTCLIKAGLTDEEDAYHIVQAQVIVHPHLPFMISFQSGMYVTECMNIHRP